MNSRAMSFCRLGAVIMQPSTPTKGRDGLPPMLGTGAIVRRPVVVEVDGAETIAIRSMMYLALSYDHRIVDGREAVQFLVKIKEFIEDPAWLLIEG